MRKKLIVGVAFAAGSLLSLGAPTAFAGEITGNGKGTPFVSDPSPEENVGRFEVSASHCSYSGLEDDDGGPNGGPGVRPQTPAGVGGQIVGFACRGSGGGAIKP